MSLPAFTRDLAIKIDPVGPATNDQLGTASVTSPVPGVITITKAPTTDLPPVGSGYTFLDYQLDITAPVATISDPLTIVFTVDAELLASVDPALTAATLTVFRNGIPVQDCTAPTDDPCVNLREDLSGGANEGDARITVLTSQASTWNVGSLPAIPTEPGAPTGVMATAGDREVTVTWTSPGDHGSQPITGYTVTASPGGQTIASSGAVTVATLGGLANGTAYTFTVKATNAVGTGPASVASHAATPVATYPGPVMVAPGLPDDDYDLFNGMTPDGSHLYFSHYHAPDLSRDLWEWVDGQTTLIPLAPNTPGPPISTSWR